jgi:hypothetical protein
MAVRSWLEKLTSPEARAALRTAAHFVLDFVGDDRAAENGASENGTSDAVKVASAVAATAGVAERLVSAARKSSGKRRGGKLALGLAVGAAVGAGVLYLASPKGRTKVRELWHRARGWRKPRSNGAPVEVPPPL